MTIAKMIKFLTIMGFILVTHRITSTIGKPIKTIKTEDGAIYDCVDFYEQPAFQHPLLKNHNFHPQMRPSTRPKWMISQQGNRKNNYYNTSYVRLRDGGCPTNTVPIRRISKEDYGHASLLSKNVVLSQLEPGTHRAIAQTKPNPGRVIYNGVGATLSLWNPTTETYQYSSGQVLIQNGLDHIQVGWTVNPTLYKDNRTHVFIHTSTAGGLHCFNVLCPGYVIVRSDMPPDTPFQEVSTRGGKIYAIHYFVYKDEANGNWWLEVLDEAGKSTPIGFWPSKIFSGLAQSGSYVECGGETYSPKPEGPPMGTGSRILGTGSPNWDAFCGNFAVVNGMHQVVDADDTQVFCDSDKYKVYDIGHQSKQLGHALFYGGPGR